MTNPDEKEKQFELFDNMPIGVFVLRNDYKVIFWNHVLETWTGIPRESIVNADIGVYFPKLMENKYAGRLANIFSGGPPVIFSSQLHRHLIPSPLPGGSFRIQHTTVTAVKTADSGFNALFTVEDVTNLTNRIQECTSLYDQTIREINERKIVEAQLHQAQKMEAVGLLAGGIAHDFNNILTAIIGYAEIILSRMNKDSSLYRLVENILISGERAAEMTNGILAFSRKQVLKMKPVDLCKLVLGFEKILSRLVPEDIDFRTKVAGNNLIIMADKGQIEQILLNLVTNAKDAMPKGGTLSIEVSPAVMNERFVHAHGFGEPGCYACISVMDTGYGMDEETAGKIFDPFFTTKEVGKGTGLGMAIVYGNIQQHNGCITIVSEQGKGTTFRIYLPLITEGSKGEYKASKLEHAPGGTETVLLAEDDKAVRELHGIFLEEAGYTVIKAVDGQDALCKYMAHMAEVDILFTDVIMPKMNGIRLYEEIRKIRPDMKALFISGYTKDIILERGIIEKEFNLVTKPTTSHLLLKKIREILDWQGSQE